MGVVLDLGSLRNVGTLSETSALPGTPNGDGGYTQTPVPLNPATWRFAVQKATGRSGAAHFRDEIISKASLMMNGRFHPGITTRTIISWTDRAGTVHTGRVIDVDDTDGLGVETWILVSEIVR